MKSVSLLLAVALAAAAAAQEPATTGNVGTEIALQKEGSTLTVPAGTRVPLVMVNSVSSKHSQQGDPVYLQSVYPVVVDGRIMIPSGTHVSGIVTRAKRPGRIKGRGTLNIEIQEMILPNGIVRDLSGRPGMLDGRSPDNFDRETGTVKSPGTKGEDAEKVVRGTVTGATIGTIAGSAAGRGGTGLGIGSAAGAAAGLAGVLLTRGPDAMLERGTHLEMILELDLHFTEEDLAGQGQNRQPQSVGRGPDPNRNRQQNRGIGVGRFPL